MRGDLASLREVRAAAAGVLAVAPRIDVLFNNAGVVKMSRETTVDGFEATFAINHLAYFLFTNLLLRSPARDAGRAHREHRLGRAQVRRPARLRRPAERATALPDLQRVRPLEAVQHPVDARAGAPPRRIGVTANCFHPGGVATRLGQTDAPWTKIAGRLLGLFMRTPERGAATGVWLATSPDVAGVSGRYFADEREKRPAKYAEDDAAAQRLWAVSEKFVASGARSEPWASEVQRARRVSQSGSLQVPTPCTSSACAARAPSIAALMMPPA